LKLTMTAIHRTQVSRMGNYHVPRRQMLCLEWIDAIALNQETRETPTNLTRKPEPFPS
jgi:hypothetical protein